MFLQFDDFPNYRVNCYDYKDICCDCPIIIIIWLPSYLTSLPREREYRGKLLLFGLFLECLCFSPQDRVHLKMACVHMLTQRLITSTGYFEKEQHLLRPLVLQLITPLARAMVSYIFSLCSYRTLDQLLLNKHFRIIQVNEHFWI